MPVSRPRVRSGAWRAQMPKKVRVQATRRLERPRRLAGASHRRQCPESSHRKLPDTLLRLPYQQGEEAGVIWRSSSCGSRSAAPPPRHSLLRSNAALLVMPLKGEWVTTGRDPKLRRRSRSIAWAARVAARGRAPLMRARCAATGEIVREPNLGLHEDSRSACEPWSRGRAQHDQAHPEGCGH